MKDHTLVDKILAAYYNKTTSFSQSIYLVNKNNFLKKIENHKKRKFYGQNILKYTLFIIIISGITSIFSEKYLNKTSILQLALVKKPPE